MRKRIALLMILAGFAVLVLSPAESSLIHFVGGMGLLLVGSLLWTGLIGSPESVEEARQRAVPRQTSERQEVAQATFRSRSERWYLLVIYGMSLFCIGLIAAMLIDRNEPFDVGLFALGAVPLAGVALGLIWFADRYRKLSVTIDRFGIKVVQLRGTKTFAWSEVVALTAWTYRGAVEYRLWSQSQRTSFSSSAIEGHEELAARISEATGLAWSEE